MNKIQTLIHILSIILIFINRILILNIINLPILKLIQGPNIQFRIQWRNNLTLKSLIQLLLLIYIILLILIIFKSMFIKKNPIIINLTNFRNRIQIFMFSRNIWQRILWENLRNITPRIIRINIFILKMITIKLPIHNRLY
jgi:hypothetical protein